MKHRISPATIIASVALFFSLGGVGIAATGYRITSIWQISPKVRHELRGRRGEAGAIGAQGLQGPAGLQGAGLDAAAAQVVSSPPVFLSTSNTAGSATAVCPLGYWATGGGFDGGGEIVTESMGQPGPSGSTPQAWTVTASLAPSTNAGVFHAEADCVPKG